MYYFQVLISCWLFQSGAACEEAELPPSVTFKWRELDPLPAFSTGIPKIVSPIGDIKPKPTTDCVPPSLAHAAFMLDCYSLE